MTGAALSQTDAHQRGIRAWITYDWANSAFATTILAAVFPVYFSTVAGATLPSAATATQYYSLTLSASVLVTAIASPLLGTVADATGTRKRLLLGFAGVGILGTAALYVVQTGDWVLAAVLAGVGRIGFFGANVFYDALLPHVARPDEVDRVSARGFAFGYLGGGVLLTANAAMILLLPDDDLGFRLSLLSVALWWAAFSIPLIRHVPEPPAEDPRPAREALRDAFGDTVATLRELRTMPDLGRYLLAFLVYNDAINVVIAAAAIYGVELGFDPIQLTLAVLLVQFVGVPYALLFGALPTTPDRRRRRALTAFVVGNIVLLPLTGIGLRLAAPADLTGAAGPPIADAGESFLDPPVGDGVLEVRWEGQSVVLTHRTGPGLRDAPITLDGVPLLEDGEAVVLPGPGEVLRSGETLTLDVETIGPHVLQVAAAPGQVEVVEVLPAERISSLPAILLAVLAVQVVAAAFALTVGGRLVAGLADALTTKRAILLSLSAYCVIAVWGFALDSAVEFWFLAWLVGVVQGGSQALSRSLYARMTPASRSGEFFGFFSILSKFASFLSPLVFAISVALFGSSRPAVLSLLAFFAGGMLMLRGVDVERGTALAQSMEVEAREVAPDIAPVVAPRE